MRPSPHVLLTFSDIRLIFLEHELGVFLVSFGGEADVVELDFVHAELGYVLGEGDVIVLNLGVRRIGPHELAVLAPRGVVLARLDGQLRMRHNQALVAEHRNTGDGVHVLLVQEIDQLRHVMDVYLVLPEQGVLEGNIDAAVGVLDIEDDGIAANFAPMLDDAESVIAGSHYASQVNGADLKILGNGDRLCGNRGGEDAGDNDVLVRFEDVAGVGLVVRAPDGVGQLGGRQVRGLAKVVAGDRRDGLAALSRVKFRARRQRWARIWDRKLGGSDIADGLQLCGRLRGHDSGLGGLRLRREFGG